LFLCSKTSNSKAVFTTQEIDVMRETGSKTRKFFGAVALILFVLIYVLVAMVAGAVWVNPLGAIAQGVFYVSAGLAWIFPAYGIIRWMSRVR
jgi:hypothetical protein